METNIFDERTIIDVTFKDTLTRHHLREPTPQEDLEFQRMLSSSRLSSRKKVKDLEWITSDKALNAPVWLYDNICEKVEIEKARAKTKTAGEPSAAFEPFEDLKKVPSRVKRAVIAEFQNLVSQGEADDAKNS